MKKIILVLMLSLFSIICSQSLLAESAIDKKNQRPQCPIIFVHGMGGWGPDELFGYFYWGGKINLQESLEENGYEVYVSDVGALSSNWDRAIELYYQIKGGQVDYGEEHSKQFGHLQRPSGKYYDHPLYPQWDANHPIHLVGHSMGGQTVRMLSALLSGQGPRFHNILRDEHGELFTPGNSWIKSITTLSAPHNGTILSYVLDDQVQIVISMMTLAGIDPHGDVPSGPLDNFNLEQWGIKREENEKLEDYIKRVFNTLGETKDIGTWDVSIAGAQELNSTVNFSTVESNTYYFSYANQKTNPVGAEIYLPALTINPLLAGNAFIMGIIPINDPFGLGETWRENDGMVNTISMKAPQLGCNDRFCFFDGLPLKGVWNYMGKLKWDHGDMAGRALPVLEQIAELKKFYLDLAERLKDIE